MEEGKIMIDITSEQKQFLKDYVSNIDELIAADDLGELLSAIDDAIVDNIMNNKIEPNEPDEIGIKIQQVYDQIYNQN